jgi:DNA-binding transcriptional regulator YiaG
MERGALMAHSEKCGSRTVARPIQRYSARDIGIDGVVVLDAVKRVICQGCNEVLEIVIPNMGELIAAAALTRASTPVKLNGKEIRFLRRALAWKSVELAKRLGVEPETVSRWESDRLPMAPNHERLLRLWIIENLAEVAPGVPVSAKEILAMEIPGLRRPGDRVTLQFYRVLLKESREAPVTEVWDVKRTGTNG